MKDLVDLDHWRKAMVVLILHVVPRLLFNLEWDVLAIGKEDLLHLLNFDS